MTSNAKLLPPVQDPQPHGPVAVNPVAGRPRTPNPEHSASDSAIQQLLTRGASDDLFSGACVGIAKRITSASCQPPLWDIQLIKSGHVANPRLTSDAEPAPVTEETAFDLGELTSCLVTTTLISQLIDQGRLSISHRVSRYIPGFGLLGSSMVTIGDLLSHTGGLTDELPSSIYNPPTSSWLQPTGSVQAVRDAIMTEILRAPPRQAPGITAHYNNVGVFLLGFICESVIGKRLDAATYARIIRPLALQSSGFIGGALARHRKVEPNYSLIAAGAFCPRRGRITWGEASNQLTWLMGGIAPHSGFFASGRDLLTFGIELLNIRSGMGSLFSTATLETFLKGRILPSGEKVRFGWDGPSSANSIRESGLSSEAFGLDSNTGCSLWIDPLQGVAIAIVANRLHAKKPDARSSIKQFTQLRSDVLSSAVMS